MKTVVWERKSNSVRATNELVLPPNESDKVTNRDHYSLEMSIAHHSKGVVHRQGGAVKDADGHIIGRDENEHCFTPRRSLCGTRDKLALAGSTAKTRRFTVTNGSADRRIDAPPVTRPGHHGPATGRKRKGHSLRSLLS